MFRFTPLSLTQVRIIDDFWDERLRVNHERSLPKQHELCERTGRFDALKLQWKPGAPNRPHPYWDSDVAKWLEAACYACQIRPDEKLRAQIDEVVQLFVGAQQPDGYLNSFFSVIDQDRRWKNLRFNHELYCAGHIFEAAVAHHELTGTRDLLDVACRFADYIDSVFGLKEGQIPGYCGHQEIELALIRLYKATGEKRYLDLSSYFVEQRGQQPNYFEVERSEIHSDMLPLDAPHAYFQAHLPIREQTEAVGHAVRATYYYSGVADIARENNDESLFKAVERLWQNVVHQKLYVTGGIGSTWQGEAFTPNYDLPNERAYCETCASVSLIFWAHRMLQHSGQATYAHVIERSLYNGALAGMSLDGESFFYQNPLATYGNHERQTWFECSCCPSNLSRLLASIGSYIYAAADDELRVHLYVGSESAFSLKNGVSGTIKQSNNTPWQGDVRFDLELAEAGSFKLSLRIPEWATGFEIQINGEKIAPTVDRDYITLDRAWDRQTTIELKLNLIAQRIYAHEKIIGNAGQVALQRGPFVYCIEDADLNASALEVRISADAPITEHTTDTLSEKGLVVLETAGIVQLPPEGNALYFTRKSTRTIPTCVRAIPYYAWGNRKSGPMRVWIPEAPGV